MRGLLGRLRDALADRYAVDSEIGRGGMATVFLAEDLRHRRQVAIKVLHPELAATLGGDHFLREIEIAAGLNHPHILPLFDSGEAAGLLYYVMPYVEGESLRDRLETEGQLPIEQAVAIAAEVGEGLDYAHRQGVIHRDIKPGNILLSEGHALIADFGLARAVDAASEGKASAIGLAVGTPDYMSPEQGAADTALDCRTDVYALGCVLWEMLAGEPPFRAPTPRAILARKAVEEAPDVRAIRGRVPEALEVCLEGALAPAPVDRFATAGEFASALRDAVVLGVTPQAVTRRKRKQRRRWVLAGLAVVVAIGGALGWRVFAKQRQLEWLRTEALPEILRLTNEGKSDSALLVANLLESSLTEADTVHIPWDFFSHNVTIETDPPGARAYGRTLDDDDDASWQFLGTTPIDEIRWPYGGIRYRFEKDGYETREFRWSGKELGLVGLDPENSTPPGMVRAHWWRSESDFHIDRLEVTNRQYQEFAASGGYEKEEYWTEPFVLDGRTLSWDEAMLLMVDSTGRPGPSIWRDGTYEAGYDDYPVGGLSWYEAVAYAQYSGKNLPSDWHLRIAMRFGSPQMILRSNLDGTGPQAVGTSPTEGPFGTYDQYGNVREWTYNTEGEGRASFGGSWTEAWDSTVDGHQILSPWDRSPENGLRLILDSDTARLTRWSEPFDPPEPMRDYWSESPADDTEYEVLARVYDYEASDLTPIVELTDTVYGWPMERVSFTGPDGTSRMGAFLFLPRDGRPPYQTVLFFNGYASAAPIFESRLVAMFDAILRTGRAVAVPILYGTYEPYDPAKGVVDGGLFWQPPEILVRWVKELMRTVDFLESRPEVDHQRIAYYGMYVGTTHAPVVLALEPRIKVGFTETGALDPRSDHPEYADPFNFLPRVRTPLLMLNPRYSGNWPYEESQLPMLEYLGTSAEHKRLVSGDYLDPVPFPDIYPVVNPWFDKYLGSVEGF